MRRPDIELTDAAAQFVERHPDLIARLAGSAGTEPLEAGQLDAQRARFRGYVRDKLRFAGTDEAKQAGGVFLARFAGR